jgi:hypothetical protein
MGRLRAPLKGSETGRKGVDRKENYFQGGVIYEVPTGLDQFDLTIQAPFGAEKVVLYGSTSPLGQIETTNLGPVLQVKAPQKKIAAQTRGLAITTSTTETKKNRVSEFAESEASITTGT